MLLSHQPGRLGMLLGETLTLAFCLLSIHSRQGYGAGSLDRGAFWAQGCGQRPTQSRIQGGDAAPE